MGSSLKYRYEHLRGQIGNRINGVIYVIDIINACVLKCPSCAVGIMPNRGGKKMSLDMFKAILDKAQSESKIRRIQLYIYADPCLHPQCDEFVAECTRRGIQTSISTMLQRTNVDFRKLIEARPTEFRISFAGWKNMGLYQRGGTVEMFERKLAMVAQLPRYPETRWTCYYHLYVSNKDEVRRAKELMEGYGIDFIAYPAIFMVNERVVEKTYTEADQEILRELLETPEQNIARLKVDTQYCQMQEKQVCIDAEGVSYLCQIVYEPRFRIGPFLEMPLKEIRRRMMEHSFCPGCKKAGGHTYQMLYGSPTEVEDPITPADHKRFKVGTGKQAEIL